MATEKDLSLLADDLKIPQQKIAQAVALLDDGNTIPFITRFRKDSTGGLNERELREIKVRIGQLRSLRERKQIILKSIESQDKLTDEIRERIDAASTVRLLEDLYLPFKPKKQTLAQTARQKGLEPLARDVLQGAEPEIELAARARDYVRVDKGLSDVDQVMEGIRHILAEWYSERAELRAELRNQLWKTGKLTSQLIGAPNEESTTTAGGDSPSAKATTANLSVGDTKTVSDATETTDPPDADGQSEPAANDDVPAEQSTVDPTSADATTASEKSGTADVDQPDDPADAQTPVAATGDDTVGPDAKSSEPTAETAGQSTTPAEPASEGSATPAESSSMSNAGESTETSSAGARKKSPKKKKAKQKPVPFAEFDGFSEALNKCRPHQVLALNRGEKAGKLKVKLVSTDENLVSHPVQQLVPGDHPFCEFLKSAATDGITRLVLPSLEREIRRELTERAESHAVDVFARNLRKLLLQPPVDTRCVMAIDPGFRNGCKLAVVDSHGQSIAAEAIHIVGSKDRRTQGREKLVELVKQHHVKVIAIGNGSGCRQAEQLVSEVIGDELKENDVRYVIVNEAGASVYSTSELGREELPDHDPMFRSAISIARRLLDPLSELVKINPANIGVGMYQHDIKAKHLQQSLIDVVESCVNYVGVNVNTASPALLNHVAGFSQLTARHVYEHRKQHGPFTNRQQLREVQGIGDATFVQAAGFLRIFGGDNPLDQTSIHPESYDSAKRLLDEIEFSVDQLARPITAKPDDTKPDDAKPDDTKPDDTKPDDAKPDDAKPDDAKPDDAKPDGSTTTASPDSQIDPPATTEDAAIDDAPPVSPETTPSSESPASEEPAEGETPIAAQQSVDADEMPASSTPEAPASELPTSGADTTQTAGGDADSIEPASASATEPSDREPPAFAELRQKLREVDISQMAGKLSIGQLLMKDLLSSLRRPGRDPRENLPKPIFRRGILKIEDLESGMDLKAQVLNVVDFGVFVDIGLGESAMVHISQLSHRFIHDPHQFFSVGDTLDVWVVEIDKPRRRVKLTAIRPGSKPPPAKGQRQRGRSGRRPDSGSERHGGAEVRSGSRQSTRRSASAKPRRPKTVRPRKPKPVKPITEAMVEGDEPMRSFSDLLQFHKKKSDKPGDNE